MTEKASPSVLLVVNRWLVVVLAVLMVITAALAGNGIFRSSTDPWLITGHQHLGNFIFLLVVVHVAISYALYSQGKLRGGVFITSLALLLLTIAQSGLGYATRNNMVDIVGWHIALGVLLTAVIAALATQLWSTRRG